MFWEETGSFNNGGNKHGIYCMWISLGVTIYFRNVTLKIGHEWQLELVGILIVSITNGVMKSSGPFTLQSALVLWVLYYFWAVFKNILYYM
jgi:hypothetical protein